MILQYHALMREAVVLMHALVNAIAEGKISTDEACEVFEPYREYVPEIYDSDEMEEYEKGFFATDTFVDWGFGRERRIRGK